MADEIINSLGFDVSKALQSLQNLDAALKSAGASFNTFGTQIDTFNGRAAAALDTMKGLASAAGKLSGAMNRTGTVAPVAPAVATPTQTQPSFWLPPGVQQQLQQANQTLAQVGRTGQQAGQNVAGGMNSAAGAVVRAKNEAEKFVVSFQTISRVVMTQFIVRVMSQIRNSIKDATASAIEFQQAVAEIRTIAPKLGGDFQSVQREVTEFSKSFNIPLPQVTEGLYETISNQFDSMSERSEVMAGAMKLSRVAVMDYADSIRLLTSTLQAYGMASAESESVAAKFFTVINLGQIRGKELADTIGQVIPIAAQLDISLDELNAAIISMTIGGLDAHKTMTGLRAAMSGFLKPSEDMKRVLRELGYSSSEQIIAAKGFQGALEAVADASNNMASDIAKSFRNVRALTTELRLTQNGAKQVEEALVALANSTPASFNKIFEEFRSTEAEKLTEQINKLKVTLTQDLGSVIVQILNDVVRLSGGADNLAAVIQGIAAAAVPAAAAMAGLAAAFAVANIALGPVGWGLLFMATAITARVGAEAYAAARQISEIRKLGDERRKVALETVKTEQEALRQIREANAADMEAARRDWEERASTLRKDYFRALDDLKVKNKEIIESDRTVMQSMIASQQKVVNAYRSAANQNVAAITQSRSRQVQAEAQFADALFKSQSRSLSGYQKVEAYMRRASSLAREANNALAAAKTDNQIQAALAMQSRAEAAAQEAVSLAESSGSILLQQDAQRSLLGVYHNKIEAERQLQALQSREAQANAQRAADEQARVNRMKVAMKGILEALQAFDKEGAKSPQQLARQQEALQKNLARLREDWLGGQQIDVSDMLAMDKLQQRVETALEGGVSDIEVQRLFARPDTFEAFRTQIEQGVGPVRVLIEQATRSSPALRGEMQDMTAEESVQHLSKRLSDWQEVTNKYQELANAYAVASNAVTRAQQDARMEIREWITGMGRQEAQPLLSDNMMKFNFPEKFKIYEDAILNFARLAEQFSRPGATIDEEKFQALNDAYKKYLDVIQPGEASREKLLQFMAQAQQATSQVERAKAMQKGMEVLEADMQQAQQEIPAIQQALDAAEQAARQAATATDQAALSSDAAAQSLSDVARMDMSGLIGQISQAATAMQSLAVASANVRSPSVSMQRAASGGMMRYLAAGGTAGTDVIPAMLSPGEFVMNAASTRKFASQLVAMNAGVQPVFRSEGGSVTNIGDVSITVNDSGNPQQTAREVMRAIRRESRRGASHL